MRGNSSLTISSLVLRIPLCCCSVCFMCVFYRVTSDVRNERRSRPESRLQMTAVCCVPTPSLCMTLSLSSPIPIPIRVNSHHRMNVCVVKAEKLRRKQKGKAESKEEEETDWYLGLESCAKNSEQMSENRVKFGIQSQLLLSCCCTCSSSLSLNTTCLPNRVDMLSSRP